MQQDGRNVVETQRGVCFRSSRGRSGQLVRHSRPQRQPVRQLVASKDYGQPQYSSCWRIGHCTARASPQLSAAAGAAQQQTGVPRKSIMMETGAQPTQLVSQGRQGCRKQHAVSRSCAAAQLVLALEAHSPPVCLQHATQSGCRQQAARQQLRLHYQQSLRVQAARLAGFQTAGE